MDYFKDKEMRIKCLELALSKAPLNGVVETAQQYYDFISAWVGYEQPQGTCGKGQSKRRR